MNLEICLYAWWCLLWTFTSLLCGQVLLHKESKAGHAKLKPFKFHTSMRKDIYKKLDHRVCIGSLSCSFIKLNQKIDFLNTAVIKVHVKNVTYTAGLPHREDGLSRCWNYWVWQSNMLMWDKIRISEATSCFKTSCFGWIFPNEVWKALTLGFLESRCCRSRNFLMDSSNSETLTFLLYFLNYQDFILNEKKSGRTFLNI